MARGPPGGILGVLGGVVAAALLIAVATTVFMVYRRKKKTRTETDNDLTDLPPAHKPAPPPPKKKSGDLKGHLTSEDIQVVHLDKDEEMQKLPLQPPYYDMAPSESTPFTDKPNSALKDSDVQYAELDTAALAPFPSDSGFKNCGRYEAPNAAECVSYQRVNQQDHFLESQPCQTYPPPVTFLPQNPYSQPPSNNPMYPGSYPAPGQGQGEAPRPLFPKEQSV
ncbi:hypothetical protein UPYG_G00193350 [Umbra pygmaea]|uniref:Uncharacterized protein n=1 Tax=Umbra pygmaea TaxID=75934 RepID=A0ABD0WYU5_UMBPY